MTNRKYKPSLNVTCLDGNGKRISDQIIIDCKAATAAKEINQSAAVECRGDTIDVDLIDDEMQEIRRKRHLLYYIRQKGDL